mmetsp:Transcript_19817/g.22470  ORF Transcript_19817/g.22470 Transcript_19817/m.22470 type:complete len:379 (+) Transcript_19817:32-1168(+)
MATTTTGNPREYFKKLLNEENQSERRGSRSQSQKSIEEMVAFMDNLSPKLLNGFAVDLEQDHRKVIKDHISKEESDVADVHVKLLQMRKDIETVKRSLATSAVECRKLKKERDDAIGERYMILSKGKAKSREHSPKRHYHRKNMSSVGTGGITELLTGPGRTNADGTPSNARRGNFQFNYGGILQKERGKNSVDEGDSPEIDFKYKLTGKAPLTSAEFIEANFKQSLEKANKTLEQQIIEYKDQYGHLMIDNERLEDEITQSEDTLEETARSICEKQLVVDSLLAGLEQTVDDHRYQHVLKKLKLTEHGTATGNLNASFSAETERSFDGPHTDLNSTFTGSLTTDVTSGAYAVGSAIASKLGKIGKIGNLFSFRSNNV